MCLFSLYLWFLWHGCRSHSDNLSSFLLSLKGPKGDQGPAVS